MIFKGKDRDIEINFEAYLDLGYWALPISICFIPTPHVSILEGGWAIILRVGCLSFSWEVWKWKHEVVDVNDSVEDILGGLLE